MTVIADLWIRRVHREDDSADFVYVASDDGEVGMWGPVLPVQSALILYELRADVCGSDVVRARRTVAHYHAGRHASGYRAMASAAVDLAIWDLRARAERRPVADLLGIRKRHTVPCYASVLGLDVLDESNTGDFVRLSAGFWGLKVAGRVTAADGRAGARRLANALCRLREAGVDRLMLDVFGKWDVEYALYFLSEATTAELTWLEEPVPADDIAGYRAIAKRTNTPIAAGEHAYSAEALSSLADAGVAVLQPDAGWCGTLDAVLEGVAIAERYGTRVFPHGAGLLAALHVAAGTSGDLLPALEYHTSMEPRRQKWWRSKATPVGGELSLPERGFGIALDDACVARADDFRAVAWQS